MKKRILIGWAVALSIAVGGGIAFAQYWGGYGGPMMGSGYVIHLYK